jgi:outer membrane protein OmpA-like peptidoglycan-associated protein
MNKVYNTLKTDVSEASVTILKDSVKVIFPEHLLFGKNSASISEVNKPLMQRFARALNLYTETSILINGYTDNSGSEELNRTLSSQRADTASATLKIFKVASKRLYTWGLGANKPSGRK